ncbi:hypothetical protein MK079_02865 [Candidatus Gracilibacteria bacterium]|nr:hypothetical protein [Candidatus Gracilibacteria bacterium]
MSVEVGHLRSGEQVEMVVRRHWIVFAVIGIIFGIGVVFSCIVYALAGFGPVVHMFQICFWLVFSMCLYVGWLNHELDLFVVTNNRIIGIEQISFLNRTVSETILGQLQEVNSHTKGFFANILNFGSLDIQTAGNKTTLTMGIVPDVITQARKINNIADKYKDRSAQHKTQHIDLGNHSH